MPKITFFLLLLLGLLSPCALRAQIRLNEASNKNATQIADENGDFGDWIELYNPSGTTLNLQGYALSDDSAKLGKWIFPTTTLPANGYKVIFASGKNRYGNIDHWETPVSASDTWHYVVPDAQTSLAWKNPDSFNVVAWNTGIGYIGYGDGDDSTVVPNATISVYMAKKFVVTDTASIEVMVLDMDYDDGFIAYLNGEEIARSATQGGSPVWNAPADAPREATMYQNQLPEHFIIPKGTWRDAIKVDTNIFTVEVHNIDTFSSDLSAIPFLSVGLKSNTTYWNSPPAWFSQPVGSLHTNFKISSKGETLYLSNPQGVMIDTLTVGRLDADYSVGATTDGAATHSVFMVATPNASNNTQTPYSGYETEPVITLAAGFYGVPQTTSITTTSAGQIRYTTNGDFPTLTNSVAYSAPISINASMVVRARCFSAANLLPSRTATASYFIADTATLPIISIATDSLSLFGANGIYDNWWTDWKRPCHVEYFDRQRVQQFSQLAALKIDGGAGGSRSHPQRSFRVEPRNPVFGDGDVTYPLFSDKPAVTAFETFYLRNGSNMYNVLPYKDAWQVSSNYGTYNNFQAYEPVIVYLNGKYWGVYELREKQDKGYFKYNFGADRDSIDLLSVSYWYGGVLRTVEGADKDFLAMQDTINSLNPADATFYGKADSLLDLPHFADYIIAQTWFANTDWPYNNMKIWRSQTTDNKWHYGLIDLEWAMGEWGWTNPYMNMIDFVFDPNIGGYTFIKQLGNLINNLKFRDYFINRYADLMNVQYTQPRFEAIDSLYYARIAPEMPRHYALWGDGSPIANQMGTLDYFRSRLLDDFALRTPIVRDHIQTKFSLAGQVNVTLNVQPAGAGRITISTIEAPTLPWTGVYFNGVPVTITAQPNPGYTFDSWVSNAYTSDTTQASITQNIGGNATFTARFFGSALDTPKITISEINYNSEPTRDADDWVELHNNGTATMVLDGWIFRDNDNTHSFAIPAGTTLLPNAYVVLVRDSSKFKTQHPGIPFIGNIGFGLSGTTDQARIFDTQGVLWASVTYVDSLFPAGADGRGRTLELKDPKQSLDLPSNWFDGCVGGSPAAAYSPCSEPLVVSEINYNSDSLFNTNDWVELRNIGATAIDLSGWKFRHGTDTSTYTLPAATLLAPYANLVLVQNLTTFDSLHANIPARIGAFGFNLSGSGDWLRVYDATGKLYLSVVYDDKQPWDTTADGGGYTLELLDSLGVMNAGTNWFAGCLGGSPGRRYTTPCATSIAPDAAENGAVLQVAPNPATHEATLTVLLRQTTRLQLRLLDISGKQLWLHQQTTATGEQQLPIPLHGLAQGMYLLEVRANDRREVIKLMKE